MSTLKKLPLWVDDAQEQRQKIIEALRASEEKRIAALRAAEEQDLANLGAALCKWEIGDDWVLIE